MKSQASKFCGGAMAVAGALLGLAGSAVFAFLALLIPVHVLADTVVPSTFATSLKPGKSVTITKTVTIKAGAPKTALVDVFFLADTTGSMSEALANVQAGAATIMANTSTLGDVAYGVGEYKDYGSVPPDPFVYRLNQDITKDKTLVQTGINAWVASGGENSRRVNYMPFIRWPTPFPGDLVPLVSSSGLGMLQAMIPADPLRELP